MSLNFLPTPAFLAIVLGFSVVLLFYAAKTFSGNEKLLAMGYSLLGLSGLSEAIIRGIEEYFKQARHFNAGLNSILGVFLVGGFSLIALTAWKKTKEDPLMRKILVISLSVIVAVIWLVGAVVLATKK